MTITINGTTGIAGVDGSAATPSVQGADTNTGMFFPAADTVGIATGGTEKMRIDASGNVGIGETNPARKLVVVGGAIQLSGSTSAAAGLRVQSISGAATLTGINNDNNTNFPIAFVTSAIEAMRIDTSNNLKFDSGYGSAATAYGCRAWVNFNGTTNVGGFCTIRGSGNVTSVTDNATGDYTVNFTTAMPDINYCTTFGVQAASAAPSHRVYASIDRTSTPTTTSIRIITIEQSAAVTHDPTIVDVAIFR